MNGAARIESRTGATRAGAPLAVSRAPAEDLRPWFYWMSIAEGTIPPGERVRCGRFSDHASIMIIYGDPWTLHTADGTQTWDPGPDGRALYFGPHSYRMPVQIAGRYTVIKLQFHAGASSVLDLPDQSSIKDRVIDCDELFGRNIAALVDPRDDFEQRLRALEQHFMRPLVAGAQGIDPLVTDFETQSFMNPDFAISEFALRHGVSKRTVERNIRRGFGMTPKQALRRARVMDAGAALLGVARTEDDDDIALRYFDQSHLIREVRAFFGMSPGELKGGAHPFLRIAIEARQRRRLDVLNKLGPFEPGPWRNPEAEPEQRHSA